MQQEALFEIGYFLIASSVLATIAAGSLLWIFWLTGKRKWNLCGDRSSELVTRLPQPFPRWSFPDFLLMFGLMLVVGTLMSQWSASDVIVDGVAVQSDENTPLPPSDAMPTQSEAEIAANPEPKATATSLVKLVRIHLIVNVSLFVILLLHLRVVQGATLSHLSLIPRASDLRRGMVAAVWILAPVLILNVIVVNFIEYEHKVTDLLAIQNDFATFAFLLFSAAFVTPVVEEFQFRLLLQGGLQKLADPYTGGDPTASWRPTAWWPVLVSSLFFALMHFGQGGAPIALFFLSIGLGFLYQRTGRLYPAILVHMILNGATLCMEFCRINANL
jgi:membrane protease YdiL (CAAX protease family)